MSKLALYGGNKSLENGKGKFVWPRITKNLENIVINQLHSQISIYNKSGIFKEFEDKFSFYHDKKFAVLSNSGTSAIFSMFEGIGLMPGDEVICPTYTFFATISSIVYTGASPIFCDSGCDGNIDVNQILEKVTNRTKAIIVTHMWGIPCDMDEICLICDNNNILLLEDCSHAHGASYKGRKVGSFGIASAWSLQGAKIITGGEGGIMLTDSEEIYYKALLQGHYNKRCKQEIPDGHPLKKFALTGYGLKLRAHPLAIAIANEQFQHLDQWIKQKNKFAKKIITSLDVYPFLKMPIVPEFKTPSWYSLVMQYDEKKSNGVSIDKFIEALVSEGLVEVDRPGSTKPIHNLPLFTNTDAAMPRLYNKSMPQNENFYISEDFYRNAIKIPVWAFEDDAYVVDGYIAGFKKVCNTVKENPNLLRSE